MLSVTRHRSSWGGLPDAFLAEVINRLKEERHDSVSRRSLPAMRLTNRHWRRVVEAHVEYLKPSGRVVDVMDLVSRKFVNVKFLDLMGCRGKDSDEFLPIKGLHQLEGISFQGRFVSDRVLELLRGLSNLVSLDLSGGWHLNNVTDDGVSHLGELVNLRHLDISWCPNLTAKGTQYLTRLTNLEALTLSGCELLSDEVLAHVCCLPKLEFLELNRCLSISNDGLGILSKRTSLTILNLDRCVQITDRGLSSLTNLTKLKTLDFGSCLRLTTRGLSNLVGLEKLGYVSLEGCWQVDRAAAQGILADPS